MRENEEDLCQILVESLNWPSFLWDQSYWWKHTSGATQRRTKAPNLENNCTFKCKYTHNTQRYTEWKRGVRERMRQDMTLYEDLQGTFSPRGGREGAWQLQLRRRVGFKSRMMREEERGELNCNGIYFMAVGVVPIEGARKTNITQDRDAERINLVVQDNLVNVMRRRWCGKGNPPL